MSKLNYTSMETSLSTLVKAVRSGDTKALDEIKRRAAANKRHDGTPNRAELALEGLEKGKPASIGEFFAEKAAERASGVKPTAKPKAKAKPASKAKPAPVSKATASTSAWAFVTKGGTQFTPEAFADLVSRATKAIVQQALES